MKATTKNGTVYEGTAEEVAAAMEVAAGASVYAWRSMSFDERLAVGRRIADESGGRITLTQAENGDATLRGEFKKRERRPLKFRTGAGWVYRKRKPEEWLLKCPEGECPKTEQGHEPTKAEHEASESTIYVKASELERNGEETTKKAILDAAEAAGFNRDALEEHVVICSLDEPKKKVSKIERVTLHQPKKLLKKLLAFTSRDKRRPILGCVHLNGERHEFNATDSFRLAFVPGYDGPTMDVPREAVAEIVKRAGVKSDVTLGYIKATSQMHVAFETTRGERVTKVYDVPSYGVSYPNVASLFPSGEASTKIWLKASELERKCRDFKKIAPRGTHMRICVSSRSTSLEFTSGDVSGEYDMGLAADGEDTCVAVNMKYLADAAAMFNGDDAVEMRIQSPTKPIHMTDGEINVVVMPIVVRSAGKAA